MALREREFDSEIGYADLEFANEYFNTRSMNYSGWNDLDNSTKSRSLYRANRILNQIDFVGTTSERDQDWVWPRRYAYNMITGGQYNDSDMVCPTELSEASSELALWLGRADRNNFEYRNVKTLASGMSFGYDSRAKKQVPDYVLEMINHIREDDSPRLGQ